MQSLPLAPRLRRLPRTVVLGCRVSVAAGARARLLGLALLERGQVGEGLLIPSCRSIHTFGMRFPLDVVFLDGCGGVLAVRLGLAPHRFAGDRRAAAVLELPAGGAAALAKSGFEGGESLSRRP